MVNPIDPTRLPSSPLPTSDQFVTSADTTASTSLAVDHIRTSSGGTEGTDARRDKMFQQQLNRLGLSTVSAGDDGVSTWKNKLGTAWQSWTRPDVEPKDIIKEQVAAIDNLVALQEKRSALPLQAVALRDDMFPEVRWRGWEALAELAPYFDTRDLQVLPDVIDHQLADLARQTAANGLSPSAQQAFSRLWRIKSRIEDETTRRRQGGQAKDPDVNLVMKNYKDAAYAILKTPVNIALGLARTVVQDPVKAPSRLAYGMGSSLVHAVGDLPSEMAGLATAGAMGASGDELGDKLANTLIWALPVAGSLQDRRSVATDIPEFKEVQEKSGGHLTRIMYGTKPNFVVRNYHKLKLGATNIEYLEDNAQPRKVKGAVWHESEFDARTVKGDVNLAHESFRAYDYFDNKLHEAEFLEQVAPGSVPKTVSMKDVAARLGLKRPATMAEKLAYLETTERELRSQFPDGYILKDVKAANTGGNLPTDKTDLVAMYKGHQESFVPFREKISRESKDPNFDVQNVLRTHEFHAGETLDVLLDKPDQVIVQQKVKLSRYTNKPLPRHVQPFNEYRIHVVKGKVLPGGSSHRWGITQTLLQAEQIKKAEAFVQSVFDKFPKHIKNKLSFAPDVALLEDGSYVFIELNVGGASGFLTRNPLAAEALAEAVTGKESHGKTIVRSLGSGVVAGTVAGTQLDRQHEE